MIRDMGDDPLARQLLRKLDHARRTLNQPIDPGEGGYPYRCGQLHQALESLVEAVDAYALRDTEEVR